MCRDIDLNPSIIYSIQILNQFRKPRNSCYILGFHNAPIENEIDNNKVIIETIDMNNPISIVSVFTAVFMENIEKRRTLQYFEETPIIETPTTTAQNPGPTSSTLSKPENSAPIQQPTPKINPTNSAHSFWPAIQSISGSIAAISAIGLFYRGFQSLSKKGNNLLGDKVMWALTAITLAGSFTYSLDDINLTAKKEDHEPALKKRH